MRFKRPSLVLLLVMCPVTLRADEHKYSSYIAGAYSRSNGTKGLHFGYEDTTKRPPFCPSVICPPEKHPWSLLIEVIAENDGPETQYTTLLGGRRSRGFGTKTYFVFSGQFLLGYTWIGGAKNRIRAQSLLEEARKDGGLVAADIGLDYLLGERLSRGSPADSKMKPIEDGPRVQVGALYQVWGTPGWHFRASLGWVIRYR